jgi:hypothetical protein
MTTDGTDNTDQQYRLRPLYICVIGVIGGLTLSTTDGTDNTDNQYRTTSRFTSVSSV